MSQPCVGRLFRVTNVVHYVVAAAAAVVLVVVIVNV